MPPVEVSRDGPHDLLRVPTHCDDEEEQGGAWVLVPEGVPCDGCASSWRGGEGRSGWAQPRGMWVAGGRARHRAGSRGKASHTAAYGGVGLVPSYTGLLGRGGVVPRTRLPRIS